MTLIAHGILALDAAIKKKKMEKAKANYDEDDSIVANVKKEIKSEKYKKAIQRLKKFKRFEGELNEMAQWPLAAVGIKTKYKETPIALEQAILSSPFVAVLGIVDMAVDGVKSVINAHKEQVAAKKEKAEREAREEARVQERKIAEQKRIENKAALIRSEKEQAAIDNAEETVEDEEIKAIEQIIAESRIVDFHTTDITKDKSAIVKGLTNENGKVIEIDDDHIVFLYNFANQPVSITKGNYEASVFFINPETGNYEQIAKFKSKRAMERLKRAVNKKLDEMERYSKRHEEAQQIQHAQMLQSQGRK
jgi:uncharacterized membrane protein